MLALILPSEDRSARPDPCNRVDISYVVIPASIDDTELGAGDLCIQRHRHRSRRMHDHQSRYEYNRMSICTWNPWNHINIRTSSYELPRHSLSAQSFVIVLFCIFPCIYTAFSNRLVTLYQTPFKFTGVMTQMDLFELSYIKVHCTRLQEAST